MICVGRCEAFDLVPTADDAVYRRCDRSGVRIRETIDGRPRHRTVCQEHGWDPLHTPPVDVDDRELALLRSRVHGGERS